MNAIPILQIKKQVQGTSTREFICIARMLKLPPPQHINWEKKWKVGAGWSPKTIFTCSKFTFVNLAKFSGHF